LRANRVGSPLAATATAAAAIIATLFASATRLTVDDAHTIFAMPVFTVALVGSLAATCLWETGIVGALIVIVTIEIA